MKSLVLFSLSLATFAFGSGAEPHQPDCPKQILAGHFQQTKESLTAASGRYNPTSEPSAEGLIPAIDTTTQEKVLLLLKSDRQSAAEFGDSVSGYLAASQKGLGPTAEFYPEAGLLVLKRPPGRFLKDLGETADFEPLLIKIFAKLRALHAAGLHHGNLRAESVLVEDSGEVSLIGFSPAGNSVSDYASLDRFIGSVSHSFKQTHSHTRIAAKLLSFPLAPRYGDKTIETYGPELIEKALEIDAKASGQTDRFWRLYQFILEKHSNGTIVQVLFSDPITSSPVFLQSIPSIRRVIQLGWNEIAASVASGQISIPEYTRLIDELSSEEPKASDTPNPSPPAPRGMRTWGTIGAVGALSTAAILYYAAPEPAPPAENRQVLPTLEGLSAPLRPRAETEQALPILEAPPLEARPNSRSETLPTGDDQAIPLPE